MNFKTLALLGLPVVLFGCPAEDSDTAIDTGLDTDVPTDTDPPTDTDVPTPPLMVSVTRGPTALTLTITNGTENYELGFAETAVEAANGTGWFGEDCHEGQGATLICHPAGQTGVSLTGPVGAIGDIVPGQSTLLQMDQDADRLTYILIGETSNQCWVFGDDITWYGDHANGPCTEIPAANVTLN